MHFLIDAQLPVALARWLTSQGCGALHVSDRDMSGASDSVIWEYAIENNAIVITKDEDFAQRRWLTIRGPVIVWIRIGNTRTSQLLEWFERGLPVMLAAIERGDHLIELV